MLLTTPVVVFGFAESCQSDCLHYRYWRDIVSLYISVRMMTSSNGNIFRVTGHLCGEFTPHKGQWCGDLMFSLICVWINGWVNNRDASDLRRYRAHHDVILMQAARSNDDKHHHITDCPYWLRPRQNGRHFPHDIFKSILLDENIWISITISLRVLSNSSVNIISALVQTNGLVPTRRQPIIWTNDD